ncbi:MAG TPA: hypothetical protein PLL25_01100 [Flavobacteriales bacterium]|jgi:hypothetical protein|nr:hypothetical protein [Flavobacteriales bacterium]
MIVCFGPGPKFKGGIAQYNTALARRVTLSCCLLFASVISSAQRNCDTTSYGDGEFFRIFGGTAEPWQNCGDTIIVKNTVVIYSFTQCVLWAENKQGKPKWIFDLGSMTACKLIAFEKPEGPYPEALMRTDIVFQTDDKRIFALRASNGTITAVRREIFESKKR